MQTSTPSHETSLDPRTGIVHFSITGFWETERMRAFLEELNQTSLPLVKAGRPILVAGDFSDFVPQDRETAGTIHNHLMNAKKFGLQRVAIIGASALMKMQYRRLSQGIEVEFFDTKDGATAWLRADR